MHLYIAELQNFKRVQYQQQLSDIKKNRKKLFHFYPDIVRFFFRLYHVISDGD